MAQKKKILVPVKPAQNHNKALETAMSFAKDLCADIHFISLLPLELPQISEAEAIADLSLKIKICSNNKISATYELANIDSCDEIGVKLAKIAEKFLNQYLKVMPRTMLRYAIERMPETRRKSFLKK